MVQRLAAESMGVSGYTVLLAMHRLSVDERGTLRSRRTFGLILLIFLHA